MQPQSAPSLPGLPPPSSPLLTSPRPYPMFVAPSITPTILYRLLKKINQSSSVFFSPSGRSSQSGRTSSGLSDDMPRAREASWPANTVRTQVRWGGRCWSSTCRRGEGFKDEDEDGGWRCCAGRKGEDEVRTSISPLGTVGLVATDVKDFALRARARVSSARLSRARERAGGWGTQWAARGRARRGGDG